MNGYGLWSSRKWEENGSLCTEAQIFDREKDRERESVRGSIMFIWAELCKRADSIEIPWAKAGCGRRGKRLSLGWEVRACRIATKRILFHLGSMRGKKERVA